MSQGTGSRKQGITYVLDVVSVTEAEMVNASVTSATSGTPILTLSVLETPIVEAAECQINDGIVVGEKD